MRIPLFGPFESEDLVVVPALASALRPSVSDPLISPTPYVFGPDGPGILYSFNRKWALTLISPLGPPVTFTSLRMVFSLEKITKDQVPLCQGSIQVYNLSDLSRSADSLKGTIVNFSAGYNLAIPMFLNGNLYHKSHAKKGADVITTYEISGSAQQLSTPVLGTTFPKGTPLSAIIAAVTLSAGLILLPPIGFFDRVFNSSVTVVGTCASVLNTLLGDDYFIIIEGLTVQIVRKSFQVPSPSIKRFNASTGLLSSPSYGSGGNDKIISFSVLLDPTLQPGMTVIVEGAFVSGPVQLVSVKFEGDTHGNKWAANCEGTLLG